MPSRLQQDPGNPFHPKLQALSFDELSKKHNQNDKFKVRSAPHDPPCVLDDEWTEGQLYAIRVSFHR